MSLNYNYADVKGHKDFTEEQFQMLDNMIWMTMAVGMMKITEENHKEFFARLQFIEKLHGALMGAGPSEKFFTIEDVKMCIGLSTNASTFTRPQFIKHQSTRFFKERGVK